MTMNYFGFEAVLQIFARGFAPKLVPLEHSLSHDRTGQKVIEVLLKTPVGLIDAFDS